MSEGHLQFYKYVPRNPVFSVPCGHYHNRNVLLVSDNIVFPDRVGPGALHMKRSRIYKIYEGSINSHKELSEAARTIDHLGGKVVNVGSLVISPGVIDVHVHLNEPGRRDWEGISHGTRAAAAGGITTIVDMPLNCKPAMTSLDLMHKKLRRVWVRGCEHVTNSRHCARCLNHALLLLAVHRIDQKFKWRFGGA